MSKPGKVLKIRAPFAAAAAALLAGMLGVAGPLPARAAPAGSVASGQEPRVLTVGTFDGKRGEFQSIQAAVDAALPGDWIVIAPGDYKERGDYTTHPPAWRSARAWRPARASLARPGSPGPAACPAHLAGIRSCGTVMPWWPVRPRRRPRPVSARC